MLGRPSPAPTFLIGCSPLLIGEHHQNLEDQAEGSMVSGYNVPDPELYLIGL